MEQYKTQPSNNLFPNRKGKTPFHIELKFTGEQWAWLGVQAGLEKTSRYNYLKHRIFNGTPLEDHSQHHASIKALQDNNATNL